MDKKSKRPNESSLDDDETMSHSKKMKMDSGDKAAVDKSSEKSAKAKVLSPLNKEEKSLKKDEENVEGSAIKKSSQNESSRKTLKRADDSMSADSLCMSPSKKRKVAEIQDEQVKVSTQQRDDVDKKRKKMKKRALLKAVMEQMEFYFSDSNLSKDRFLKNTFDSCKDGYVDLSVFSKFNKLQSLHKDGIRTDMICKALAKSKVLEVSEDGAKVKRRIPFVKMEQDEVDRRTVYVEHLPNHASHTWIRKIFSQCGKVCYVSLPKYQTTRDIKGFAFVEFSLAEEAEKACAMLNNPPPAKTEEKPGKFPKGNKTLYHLQKVAPSVKEEQDSNEENIQSDLKEEQTSTPTKKKKKKNSKRKMEDEKCVVTEQNENQEEKKKKKKKKKKQATAVEGEDSKTKVATEDNTNAEQKLRKRRKDKDPQQTSQEGDNSSIKIDDPALKKKKKKKKKKKIEKGSTDLETDKDSSSKIDMELKSVDNKMDETNIASKSISDGSDEMSTITKDTEVGKNEMKDESVNVFSGKKDTDNDVKDVLGRENKTDTLGSEVKLSRKERKLLRQEDIRRKKAERESKAKEGLEEHLSETEHKQAVPWKEPETQHKVSALERTRLESVNSESSETDSPSKVHRKSDGSQLMSCLAKSKKQDIVKKVEFDPVPITTEFVERKEVRRRKKPKRESLHLRVLSKKEWLSLREEYITRQKCHMAALKESLRELRMHENGGNQTLTGNNGRKHIDLTNVFGTKRMKPSQDVKLAHLEELKFIPNVIVQWKCSHEINRNKIKTMFPEISSDSIAYIEGKEEAKSGYIRFKDEVSAEEFARLSRSSDSFSARVLPESQQASYWQKANADRVAKLSKKKKERGSERIARKVFERNKATFNEKGSHIVFDNNDDDVKKEGNDVKDDSFVDATTTEAEKETECVQQEASSEEVTT